MPEDEEIKTYVYENSRRIHINVKEMNDEDEAYEEEIRNAVE